MLIEFNGKTYAITAVDPYEFYNTEIKIRGQEVAPKPIDVSEYEVWL
jgi:hypothetical protein